MCAGLSFYAHRMGDERKALNVGARSGNAAGDL